MRPGSPYAAGSRLCRMSCRLSERQLVALGNRFCSANPGGAPLGSSVAACDDAAVGQLLPGWHMTWSMRLYSAASTGSSTLELMDRTTVVRPSLLTAPTVLYPGTSPSCDQ